MANNKSKSLEERWAEDEYPIKILKAKQKPEPEKETKDKLKVKIL